MLNYYKRQLFYFVIKNQFEFLKKETQKAEVLVQQLKYRETLKNYQTETSIHSKFIFIKKNKKDFYQHSHFKQNTNVEVLKCNLQIQNTDVKNKFMAEQKKVKHKATHIINSVPPKVPIEPAQNPIIPQQAPYIEKKKPIQPPVERVFDNDLSYFLCSVISEQDKCGQVSFLVS